MIKIDGYDAWELDEGKEFSLMVKVLANGMSEAEEVKDWLKTKLDGEAGQGILSNLEITKFEIYVNEEGARYPVALTVLGNKDEASWNDVVALKDWIKSEMPQKWLHTY